MFPSPFYNPYANEYGIDNFDQQSKAVHSAHLHYQNVKRKSWWRQKFARLTTGRGYQLKELNQLYDHGTLVNIRPLGIQTVEIEKIVGSENRAEDFDDQFLPLKSHNGERWIKIASLMLLNINLPAVDLIKVNDSFYVRDGHHRISVAKHFGQKLIDANVMEMLINAFDLEPKPAHIREAMAICTQN